MRLIPVVCAVLLLAGMSFSVDISSCTQINSPGTYNLTADISGAPYSYYHGAYTTCIQINASSVTLDCGGHSINTTGNAAVEIEAPGTNVIVRNCVLNGGTGVEVLGLSGGRIIYNRINPSYAGIGGVLAFAGFTGSDILYNNITGGTYGIWEPGDSNLIGNNRLVNQGSIGLVDSGTGNWISNNYVSGSSGYGMMANGQGATTTSNTVSGCAQAGIFTGAWYATISNNYVSGNGEHGIQLGDGYYEANNLNVTGNQIWSNTQDGIHIEGGDYNRITGNTVYSNARGIYFVNGYYSEGGWSYARNNLVSGNQIYSNAGNGIHAINLSLNNFTSNDASQNGGRGFVGENLSSVRINPSTFCNNSGGEGVLISSSTNVDVLSSVACNNAYHGIHLVNTNYSNVIDNAAYGNGGDGIALDYGSSYNYVGANTAYGNTGTYNPGTGSDGIYLSDNANNNLVVGNTAYSNANTGISVTASTNNTLIGNFAYGQQTFYGIYLHNAYNSTVTNNYAYNNLGSGGNGFVLNGGSGHNLAGNAGYGNTANGFRIQSSNYNSLSGNTAFNNGQSGVLVQASDNNNISSHEIYNNAFGINVTGISDNTLVLDSELYGNSQAGLAIGDISNNTRARNIHLYNNARDLMVSNPVGVPNMLINLSGISFDSAAGAYANYTNLSILDNVNPGHSYVVDWSTNSPAPPFLHYSFAQKYVNITNLTAGTSIDSIAWHWNNAESAPYNESAFQVFKYNQSGWASLNSTPDIGANALSINNHNPNSIYAILFNSTNISTCGNITAPGSYKLISNLVGSTVPVSLPIAGSPQYACIRISAPNVSVNCNGYDITGNLTTGATAGIAAQSGDNSRLTNVTVINCPSISNYSAGIYLRNTSESRIENVTSHDNRLVSGVGYLLYYSPNVNLTNTAAANGYTYGYYINLGSNNVRIVNSTARNSTNLGFYFSSSVSDAYITDSVAHNNNGTGILLDGSGYAYAARNNITNDPAFNADAGMIVSVNNAIVEDNIATGAISTPIVTWGYGFIIESGNATFRRNLAYGNKVGIETFGWECNITNNTARNNLQDGFAIYSEGDTYSLNDAYQNGANGFAMNYTYAGTFTGNRAFNNTGSGFRLEEGSEENEFSGNSAYLNAHGFYINESSLNNLTGNTAYSNSQAGFYVRSSTETRLLDNIAYLNQMGIMLNSASGNVIENNTAYSHPNDGIRLSSSSSNNITGNTVYSNTNMGIDLFPGCSNNRVIGNNVTDSGQSGFYAYSGSNNNLFANNTATSNGQTGFYMNTVAGNSLTGNIITGWGNYGILVGSSNNTLIANNIINSLWNGIRVSTSCLNTVLQNNTINGSTQYGLSIIGADNTEVANDHYYNNGQDFLINGTGITVSLRNVIFDNPAGNYSGFTNLSINDTVASAYSINWSENSTTLPLPPNAISFEQKFVNITPLEGTVSIDSIVWSWLASEAAPPDYMKSNFQIWRHSGEWTNANAILAPDDNTLAITNLASFSNFAILQVTRPDQDDGGELPAPGYDVRIIPACMGFVVRVSDGGSPVADAFVTGTDQTHAIEFAPRYTNASGEAYVSGCDIEVSMKAVKSGRQGTVSDTADCGICPECATDDDCAGSERCVNLLCVPIDCPGGRVVDHACERFECMVDADCPIGQSCIDHRCIAVYECDYGLANTTEDDHDGCDDNEYCDVPVGAPGGYCKPILGCGEIANHMLIPWECGDAEGCLPCSQGFACIDHKCIQSDVSCPTTGIVGDRKTCEAKENNAPCIDCDYIVTDPTGKNMSGRTDENGNLVLPLNLQGIYKVALLRDGQIVRVVEVKALPVSQPGEGEQPSTAGGLDAGTALFLVILAAFAIAAILYWRRGKGEKKPAAAKK